MIRTERHIIRNGINFDECNRVTHLSKNLYNAGLFAVRQHYFDEGLFLNYNAIDKLFKETNNPDYRALPAKISQQVLKMVEQNFKSFYGLIKSKKKRKPKKIKIPGYLKKDGNFVTPYTIQAISKPALKDGLIKLSKTDIIVETKATNIQQVRIVPHGMVFAIEVIYKTKDVELKGDNGRYAAIDLGVNNLATLTSNKTKPLIYNGKPLKSINANFNKRKAKAQSALPKDVKTSRHIKAMQFKRNNRVSDYLHKTSRKIINQLVSDQINTLVIGHNKGWKQEINIGKVNNQKFVNIPFTKFINMIQYKAEEHGIEVIMTEESYTSKCSFLDAEAPKKREVYGGKRVHRGLFKASDGRTINADVNGSYNILTKVLGKFDYDPIVACSMPVRVNAT